MKKPLRNLAIVAASWAALELLLWTVPMPDPYPGSSKMRFHRFLPSWNHWAWKARKPPPFDGTFGGGTLAGVEPGLAEHKVNKYGFLYPIERYERASPDEIRIAAVGGSTVECIALRPEKRWPAVLEELLSGKVGGRPVTVLNLGLSNQATPTHLATTAQHAVRLDLDAVIYMLGANDLNRSAEDWEPTIHYSSFYSIDVERPALPALVWTRTQTGRRLRAAWRNRGRQKEWLRQRLEGSRLEGLLPSKPYFRAAASRRAELPVVPAEKEMSAAALEDYARDIVSLAAIARAHGIAVLFTTQPMMWKEEPSAAEEAVNWQGRANYRRRPHRLESGTSARLLESLNQQLLKTCRDRQLECVDLARSIPRSLQFFYDPVHFNEHGARKVAELLVDPLVREVLGDQAVDRQRAAER